MSEFARPIRIDQLGASPLRVEIDASAEECAALAARFALVSLGRLAAAAEIVRDGATIEARGTIDAAVVQACVATGDDVPSILRDTFALRFVPEDREDAGEIELDEQALDTLPYTGGAIDLGEAAAQTLALTLDPWPRAPVAQERLRAAGVVDEEARSPFAMLKGLGRPS